MYSGRVLKPKRLQHFKIKTFEDDRNHMQHLNLQHVQQSELACNARSNQIWRRKLGNLHKQTATSRRRRGHDTTETFMMRRDISSFTKS